MPVPPPLGEEPPCGSREVSWWASGRPWDRYSAASWGMLILPSAPPMSCPEASSSPARWRRCSCLLHPSIEAQTGSIVILPLEGLGIAPPPLIHLLHADPLHLHQEPAGGLASGVLRGQSFRLYG